MEKEIVDDDGEDSRRIEGQEAERKKMKRQKQ